MKIPVEALPLYPGESVRKSLPEGKRAEPIVASAKLDGALSHSAAEQRQGFEENLWQEPKSRRSYNRPAGEERRIDERRKANHPVLLDTRLARRRESANYSTINFEI